MTLDDFASEYVTPQHLVPAAVMGGIGGIVRGRGGFVVGALIGALLGHYLLPQAERVVILGERYANESGQWRQLTAEQVEKLRRQSELLQQRALGMQQAIQSINLNPFK